MRLAIAVFLVLGAAGCKKTLHWKLIEDDLNQRISARAPAGIKIAVSCPETGVEKGLTFRCHVTASDHSATDIEIKLLDVAGSYSMNEVH